MNVSSEDTTFVDMDTLRQSTEARATARNSGKVYPVSQEMGAFIRRKPQRAETVKVVDGLGIEIPNTPEMAPRDSGSWTLKS